MVMCDVTGFLHWQFSSPVPITIIHDLFRALGIDRRL